VTRTTRKGGEKQQTDDDPTEIIEVHKFATTPAQVSILIPVKGSKNYNSSGFEIGVVVPCYKEEMQDAIEEAYRLVLERMKVEVPKVIKAVNDLAKHLPD
jgi:hypothetical protein